MRRLTFLFLILCLTVNCWALQKNVASQKWVVFAFDETDNTAKTGDSGNITANLRIDGGAADGVDDTNPTELEDGYYVFDLAQGETNGDYILICPDSTTANIQVIGCPMATWTTPPYFPAFSIDSSGRIDLIKIAGTTQTANDMSGDIDDILTDTAAYDTDAEYATAIWNALTNAYGGAGTYGQTSEDIDTETSNLKYLLATDTTVAADGDLETYVVAGSVMAHLMSTGADVTTFKPSTDSPEAIRNRGDVAWTTAAANLEVDVTKIHGTALTETNSGDVAESFSFFFDVDPVTANTVDDVGAAAGGGSILAIGAGNLGDYKEDATVYFIWRTIDRSGAADTPSTAGTIAVYKNNGTAQVTTPTGITDTRSFDSGDTTAGVHLVVIDTSANSFYTKGQDYSIVLYGATIDTKTVTSVIATFSIEKRWTESFWEYGS